MKKPLAVAVILLFIGLAFAPCINANVDGVTEDNELAGFIDIFGGLGITVIFRNPEPNHGYNLTWSIELNGPLGFLSQRNFSGIIKHIGPKESYPIWKVVFGLYYGEIQVDIRTHNDIFFFDSTMIFVLGPLVYVRKC